MLSKHMAIKNEETFRNRLHVQVCGYPDSPLFPQETQEDSGTPTKQNGGQQLEHQTGVKLPTSKVVVEELPQATANIVNMMVSTTSIHNMSAVDYLSLYTIILVASLGSCKHPLTFATHSD